MFPQDDIGGTELPVPRFVAMSSLKELSETDVEEERLDLRSLGTEDWWWPFLVTTRIEGQPLKSIAGQLTPHNRIQMAHNLGKAVRALFDTPLPDDLPSDLSNLRKEYFPSFLDERMRECVRDHERWKTLPPRLIAEIQAYLPSPSAELLSERVEAEFGLIHADIHSEHARISLYRDEGGDQQLKFEGLIDFGDAILGTKLYEMVQVHLSNFLCDKDMLREFFEEYFGSTFLEAVFVGDEEQEEEREKKASEERTRKTLKDRFVHHCMCYSLLHEFDALSSTLFRIDFDNIRDLDHLAHLIWDLSMKEMVPRVWKQDWGWDTQGS